jgi:hypothetical protein
MIEKINLNNILFLDIETVRKSKINELDWKWKTFGSINPIPAKEEHTAEDFLQSREYIEFGKIACISVGYFVIKGDVRNFRLRLSLAKRKDFEGFQ